MIDEYIKQWITKADNDLKIVEHELKLPEEEIVKDAVCFHCQQAVEKYLKAFLIYHKKEFEKIHIIEELLLQCSKIDKDFSDIDVKNLTDFAIDVRYAEEFYIPDMAEVKFYYELTKRIRNLVFTKLGIETDA
ncbi:MAG TPA: HEPN domain-containing protein [bacterium]|nr:HEPN domain-containing protein [bacterium]HPP08550.1 HEPN domain-containing protein [bacterium]